jgi:para-nitrobenzyl esterase
MAIAETGGQRGLPTADVTTASGAVRGRRSDGVDVFCGIPYAGTTAGVRRFLPPTEAPRWTGTVDAVDLGPAAPQLIWDTPVTTSEDCLTLNLWTPASDGARRPVMVWLHGGGFSGGWATGSTTDGTYLARTHDVVVVSVAHRLNIFGHLYLAELAGDRYRDSGNVGILDIVAALRWIHANIAAFGGDPDNVTIFGVSGGGGKVAVLTGMPAARGLFHRAVLQSGPYLRAIDPVDATATTREVLRRLDIDERDVDRLNSVPAPELVRVWADITGIQGSGWLSDWRSWDILFAPVRDGVLPEHPWDPLPFAHSSPVPLLIGTTADELHPGEPLDEPELFRRMPMLGFEGESARDVVEAYRRTRPTADPAEIFSAIASDELCRMRVLAQADRAARRGAAPVFVYLFARGISVGGAPPRAFHGVDEPFVFGNVAAGPDELGAGDPDGQQLAWRTSRTWAAFARTGDPGNDAIPPWPAYSLPRRATMVIDTDWRVADDPNGEELSALAAISATASKERLR